MKLKKSSGVTFLEVEVALIILLIGILTVIGFAPLCLRGVEMAESNSLAMNYARHIMEVTKALPFDYQTSTAVAPITSAVIPGSREGFQYQVNVSTLSGNLEIHVVEVTIYWEDPASNSGATKAYELVSYSAKLQ